MLNFYIVWDIESNEDIYNNKNRFDDRTSKMRKFGAKSFETCKHEVNENLIFVVRSMGVLILKGHAWKTLLSNN